MLKDVFFSDQLKIKLAPYEKKEEKTQINLLTNT